MGPDWTDDYYSDPEMPPPAPAAPAPPQPGPPTEHPPLVPIRVPVVSQGAPRARAGLTIILTALGTGVGAALGGLQGAGAGFLIAGSARNLYRAQSGLGSTDTGESAKSLTLGILGLAAGGYLAYRCFSKKPRKNSDD